MAHADPQRKLLIERIRDAEAAARRLRRGRRWCSMDRVLVALVGGAHVSALRGLIVTIYGVQDARGATEGVAWPMPLAPETLREFESRGFVQSTTTGHITVVGDALADAYTSTLLALARRELPDGFDAGTVVAH